jgi:hypothetical protein
MQKWAALKFKATKIFKTKWQIIYLCQDLAVRDRTLADIFSKFRRQLFFRNWATRMGHTNLWRWIKLLIKVSEFDLSTVVLIGHSLGCSTIVHWATKYKNKLKVHYLLHKRQQTPRLCFAGRFCSIPLAKINFKTI